MVRSDAEAIRIALREVYRRIQFEAAPGAQPPSKDSPFIPMAGSQGPSGSVR
jgi:hypothetical protein